MSKLSKRAKNPDTPEVTSRYYITNGRMLPEVIKSKEQGVISNELANMMIMLTKRYANRPCFYGYTYKEDMIAEALANLCQNALKFNPEKSSNPFAYYTSCINNSFLQFLGTEKRHRRIRDQLLVDIGENPSFNFQEESKQSQYELKNDFDDLKNEMIEAKNRLDQDAAYAAAKEAAKAASLIDQDEIVDEIDQSEFIDEIVEPDHIPNLSLLDFDKED